MRAVLALFALVFGGCAEEGASIFVELDADSEVLAVLARLQLTATAAASLDGSILCGPLEQDLGLELPQTLAFHRGQVYSAWLGLRIAGFTSDDTEVIGFEALRVWPDEGEALLEVRLSADCLDRCPVDEFCLDGQCFEGLDPPGFAALGSSPLLAPCSETSEDG